MKINLKPVFRYQLSNFLKANMVIFLILTIIITAFLIGTVCISPGSSSTFSFTGFTITTTIFLFVMGIVNIRSDMRLCLQFGISRRTAYVSELLTVLCASIILAVAGELLTGIAQKLSADNIKFFIADLYQLIYLGPDINALTFGQHALSALFNANLMISACLLGMFFSLIFWRLTKVWTIIVAISIPIFINGIPMLLSKAGVDFEPFLNWLMFSPFCFILFWLMLAVLFGLIDWLLLRRANVKAAK